MPWEAVQLLDDSLAAGSERDLDGILDRIYDKTCHLEFLDDQEGAIELSTLLQTRYQHLAFS